MTTIPLPNGFLTLGDTAFACPACGHTYPGKKESDRLCNRPVIYKRCKCGEWLGLAVDYRGDVRVWLKGDESNQNMIR